MGIFEIGCAFGALTLGLLGNRLGRRKNIFIGTIITVVGIILQATSFSLAQLIVSRFINGIVNHPSLSLLVTTSPQSRLALTYSYSNFVY